MRAFPHSGPVPCDRVDFTDWFCRSLTVHVVPSIGGDQAGRAGKAALEGPFPAGPPFAVDPYEVAPFPVVAGDSLAPDAIDFVTKNAAVARTSHGSPGCGGGWGGPSYVDIASSSNRRLSDRLGEIKK